MIDFENVIDPGVSFHGSLRLVGDSMISGKVYGDVVCIGRNAVLYLGPQSSVSGNVCADVVVAAGVVDGCTQAKSSLYEVDGCALGEIKCGGSKDSGSDAQVFIKTHLMTREQEIDEAAIIEYAVHRHCANLQVGKAVIFEDGLPSKGAAHGFIQRLKINLFKS